MRLPPGTSAAPPPPALCIAIYDHDKKKDSRIAKAQLELPGAAEPAGHVGQVRQAPDPPMYAHARVLTCPCSCSCACHVLMLASGRRCESTPCPCTTARSSA